MTKHTDRDYEAELSGLREQLLLMAGRVEQMIADSVRSLLDRHPGLAHQTIESDHKVNRAEIQIDERCLVILARRHPMASDLRFVAACFKMVTDLERIGDLAVNICERAVDLCQFPASIPLEDISEMTLVVQSMVRDAIDAFVSVDTAKAQSVVMRDDVVDGIYHQGYRAILARMIADPNVVECGIHLQSVAKYLERMGDHATNLAEYVINLSSPQDVRHPGKLDG